MKNLLLLLLGILGLIGMTAAGAKAPPAYSPDSRDLVFLLPQFQEFEEISAQEMLFLRKTLQRAADERARVVIVELDTPGGSVETAFKYLSLFERSEVPVVVYLHPNGISAGMIIALGANRIAISPNGLIGDAMPLEMGFDGVRPIVAPPEKTPVPAEGQAPGPSGIPADGESSGAAPEPVVAPPDPEKLVEEAQKARDLADRDENDENSRLADQKFLTVFFKMLQVLAEKNDRPVKVIRAMADPYVELTEAADGIAHPAGAPLTLTAREAERLGVVDYVVANRSELLRSLDLERAEVREIRRSAWEQIGAFLALPVVAGVLLMVGIVGLYVEIRTPGFGVAGVLALTALTLFFLGHMATGASDWGPPVVFVVGLILLAVEIFVIPGFGLVGISGGLCVLISLFWAFGFDNVETAVQVIAISLTGAVILAVVLGIYVLPHTPFFRRTMLTAETSRAAGFTAEAADPALVGRLGKTLTPLRPTGVVEIDAARHDASSEGDFVDAGRSVRVVACNGFQIVVREDSGERGGGV